MSKKIKTVLIILIGLICLCVLTLGIYFIFTSGNGNDTDLPENPSQSEIGIVIENVSDQEFYYDVNGMLEINTPYCTFNYTSDYVENMEIKKLESEKGLSLEFYYIAGDRRIELFSVCFGQEERGYHFGYIETNEGNVAFSIEMSDYNKEQADSNEEFDMVCILQEHINDIIDSVVSNENFISNN